jgi:hypothetical protein
MYVGRLAYAGHISWCYYYYFLSDARVLLAGIK